VATMSAEEGVPPPDADNEVEQPEPQTQCKPSPGDALNEACWMAARIAALESRMNHLEMTVHFLAKAEEPSMPMRMRQHMLTPDLKLRPKPEMLRLGDIEELEVLLAICVFLVPKELANLACVSRCFGKHIAWAADEGIEPEWRSVVEESARRWVLEHQSVWASSWPAAHSEVKSWMHQMQDIVGWPVSFADAHPDFVLSEHGAVATLSDSTGEEADGGLRTAAGRRVMGEGLHYAVFTLLNHSSFGVYIGVVSDNCDVRGGAPNLFWIMQGTRFFHTASTYTEDGREWPRVSRGDRVGLLLDTHAGTLEVFKNDVRLGAIHAPSTDDNKLKHRVFKAQGCAGYRWAVSMSNEGQCVRIEGSAIPAGMLKEIQAREAIRCHVASLVVGAVVTFCRDAVANDFAEQHVGEIVEVKDDSPWERRVRFPHRRGQPWLLPELLVLATPEQVEQWAANWSLPKHWEATKTKEVLVARQIFSLFDADEDGKLSKSEYKSYLHGIGAWGEEPYTDASWNERWPIECKHMKCSDSDSDSDSVCLADDGITAKAFEVVLYGNHRVGKAEADLNRCNLAEGSSQASDELLGLGFTALAVEAQAVKEQEHAIDVELSKTLAQIAALDGSGGGPEPEPEPVQ
jgi:hypothetical protein